MFGIKAEEDIEMDPKNNKEVVEELNCEIHKLKVENKDLKRELEEQCLEIQDIQRERGVKIQVADRLNKEISDVKLKFRKEKTTIFKEHRKEIKFWRLEL